MPEPPALLAPPCEATPADAVQANEASQDVVHDYCATVRGILNDDQGGPLHPPGLRMADALHEVRASLQKVSVNAAHGVRGVECRPDVNLGTIGKAQVHNLGIPLPEAEEDA